MRELECNRALLTITLISGADVSMPAFELQNDSFYGATLCVNAVFAVARCLSVRPSVTLMHYIHTAEYIVKLLCRPGSPIILVLTPSAGTQFQGESLHRGRKRQVAGKFAIFD